MKEMQEMRVWPLDWDYSLEEGIATHSSILAWRIPWTEEPDRLQSIGSQRVGHERSHLAHTHARWTHAGLGLALNPMKKTWIGSGEKAIWRQRQRLEWCGQGPTKSWKRQWNIFPSTFRGSVTLPIPWLLSSRTMKGYIPVKFAAVCFSSHKKLIQWAWSTPMLQRRKFNL